MLQASGAAALGPELGTGQTLNHSSRLCIRASTHINSCDANSFCCADAPEIEVERGWVHSGEGNEAQLACIVHAEPPAEVSTHHLQQVEIKQTNFPFCMEFHGGI